MILFKKMKKEISIEEPVTLKQYLMAAAVNAAA
jgi:hypothetical protein